MKHTRILAIMAAVMLAASPVIAAEKKPDERMAPMSSVKPAAGMHHGKHHHKHHKGKHKGEHHHAMHEHHGSGPVHHSVRSSKGYEPHRGGSNGTGGWTAQ